MTAVPRFFLFVALGAASAPAQTVAPSKVNTPQPGAGRWEAKMKEYEAQDAAGQVARGQILFIGSSSITRWKLDDYFTRRDLVNRGFGGSLLRQVADLAERYVTTIAPRQIVVYAGENDIASGRTPEQVLEAFQDLIAKIRAKQPDVPVLFISLKPSPLRWNLAAAFREANRLIADEIQRLPNVKYVDVFGPMLNAQGEPRPELYVDRLHMTPEGYRIWVAILEPLLLPEVPRP